MKKILYAILSLLSIQSVHSQSLLKNQIQIEKVSVIRDDMNNLLVSMDIILQKSMKLSSNQTIQLIPVLQTHSQKKALPGIAVYGRKRAMVHKRNKYVRKDMYLILQRKQKTQQLIHYKTQLPYELWMQKAKLELNTDICGCCNIIEEEAGEPIVQLNIVLPKINPHIAYVIPKAEAVKERMEEGRSFLDFRVNQTSISPEYRNNTAELAKILATIDSLHSPYCQITGIGIHGYASPEGSYSRNSFLAKGRMESLLQYVQNHYKFDKGLLTCQSTPENWDGFRKFIVSSAMDQKEAILAIIDSNEPNLDIKEQRIAKLIGTDAYKYLLNECYPTLRYSDYKVTYTVRRFSLDEAKEIIKKAPQLLSLEEISAVANSYTTGSKEFNQSLDTAIKIYPNDAIANLNAAAIELQRNGNLSLIKEHLNKANPKEGATLNNLGVVAMLEERLDEAKEYFNAAQALGVAEAKANLIELAKKQSYPSH